MPANQGQGNIHSRTSPLPQEHRKSVGTGHAREPGPRQFYSHAKLVEPGTVGKMKA